MDEIEKRLAQLHTTCSSNGPFPSFRPGEEPFSPRFWIGAADHLAAQYEPLVVSWESHNRTTLLPDQGFLMTYGLIPRILDRDGVICWDEQQLPRYDVVKVRPVSVYDFPNVTRAEVLIAQDYLADYASLRAAALVQVYFEERWGKIDDDIAGKFGDDDYFEVAYADRKVVVNNTRYGANPICAQVYGARVLLRPGSAPISGVERDDFDLSWPSFDQAINYDLAMKLGIRDVVYVNDAVLQKFEGRPEYRIIPEMGSVAHGGQWSISHCNRVGRDLIRLELKKLYEGGRREIINHWHKYVVEPPNEQDLAALRQEANIATRAKSISASLCQLGDSLAALAGILDEQSDSKDFVGIDAAELDYFGWWGKNEFQALARHAPPTMTEHDFLSRCNDLTKAVIEALQERKLRQLCRKLGFESGELSNLRSLKLLDAIVRCCFEANESGLSIPEETPKVVARLREPDREWNSPIHQLFRLNNLRTLIGHNVRSEHVDRRNTALEDFVIDPESTRQGWGYALDTVYDQVDETLRATTATILRCIPQR